MVLGLKQTMKELRLPCPISGVRVKIIIIIIKKNIIAETLLIYAEVKDVFWEKTFLPNLRISTFRGKVHFLTSLWINRFFLPIYPKHFEERNVFLRSFWKNHISENINISRKLCYLEIILKKLLFVLISINIKIR